MRQTCDKLRQVTGGSGTVERRAYFCWPSARRPDGTPGRQLTSELNTYADFRRRHATELARPAVAEHREQPLSNRVRHRASGRVTIQSSSSCPSCNFGMNRGIE